MLTLGLFIATGCMGATSKIIHITSVSTSRGKQKYKIFRMNLERKLGCCEVKLEVKMLYLNHHFSNALNILYPLITKSS